MFHGDNLQNIPATSKYAKIFYHSLDYAKTFVYTERIFKRRFYKECLSGMADSKHKSKRVCVTMTEQDHEHLTRLAHETLRSRSGYMRWLLHQDFMERGIHNKKI